MERTMSPEERIKRAEEIYNRRVNNRNYATYKNKEIKIDSAKGKKNIAKKNDYTNCNV